MLIKQLILVTTLFLSPFHLLAEEVPEELSECYKYDKNYTMYPMNIDFDCLSSKLVENQNNDDVIYWKLRKCLGVSNTSRLGDCMRAVLGSTEKIIENWVTNFKVDPVDDTLDVSITTKAYLADADNLKDEQFLGAFQIRCRDGELSASVTIRKLDDTISFLEDDDAQKSVVRDVKVRIGRLPFENKYWQQSTSDIIIPKWAVKRKLEITVFSTKPEQLINKLLNSKDNHLLVQILSTSPDTVTQLVFALFNTNWLDTEIKKITQGCPIDLK